MHSALRPIPITAIAALVLLTVGPLGVLPAALAETPEGMPDYWLQSTWLLTPPGESPSLAAGTMNPGTWPMAYKSGAYFGGRWRDGFSYPFGDQGIKAKTNEFLGIASLKNFTFSYESFRLENLENVSDPGGAIPPDLRVNEYTLSLGGGNRSYSSGLSYTWSSGDDDVLVRHPRFVGGFVGRSQHGSLGGAAAWDVQTGKWTFQADLGIRPWGPRVTFFGDVFTNSTRFSKDFKAGFGAEVQVVPGWRISARRRDPGEYSFGLSVALGRSFTVGGTGNSGESRYGDDSDLNSGVLFAQFGGDTDPPLIGGQPHHGQAQMILKGPLPYRRFEWFDNRQTLTQILAGMSAVSETKGMDGIVLNLSGMVVSREMCWELYQQMEGVRRQGKTVVVYFDRLKLYGYMLACAADQIWMDPSGDLDIKGLAWGRTYYKDAFDKLGLGVEEWRYFEYKSAMESFARTEPSEADTRQRQQIVDEFYEEARRIVVDSRGISTADFDSVVNNLGRIMPEEALTIGMVDKLGTFEEAKESAPQVAARRPAADAPDITGVLGDRRWVGATWGEPDKIAVLYAIGACAMDTGIQGRRLAQEIEKAHKDPLVKAVVLRVDSPGGDPLPSDLVSRALYETMQKKPVVVSQGNVAASGGYWISMNSNKILASPFTLTGSIGVIAGWVWNDGAGEKLGFEYHGVQRGDSADMGRGISFPFLRMQLPDRPLNDKEMARAKHSIVTLYDEFVDKVAAGRNMTNDAVDAVGQGRVWGGKSGLDNGLVDELGGLWRAIQMAKELAGLDPKHIVALQEGPSLGFFNFAMMRPELPGFSGSASDGEPDLDALSGGVKSSYAGWLGLSQAEIDYLRALLASPGNPQLLSEPMDVHDGFGTR